MTKAIRSPFGSLIHRLRRERRWTQAKLAAMANLHEPRPDLQRPALSTRTIGAFEQRTTSPADWHAPRQQSVNALIAAFQLSPGSAEHTAMLDAAMVTRQEVDRSIPPQSVHGEGVAAERKFITTGREKHLERIVHAVDEASSGSPAALFLGGDPGTGKTWLLVEACRQAVARHPDLVVLWGNCTGRIGAVDPYQPFRQVLQSMVGDIRSATPRQLISPEQIDRLTARIPVAVDVLEQSGRQLIHRLLPPASLSNPLLLSLDDQKVHQQAADLAGVLPAQIANDPDAAMIDVLMSYAATSPVVLVLEDLHWSDTGTASLLLQLLERLRGSSSKVVVLTSFRPGPLREQHHPLPPILSVAPDLFHDPVLDLSSLLAPEIGRAFITALAELMAIDLSDDDLTQIQQQTLGLPIFVNGALRLLRADSPTVVSGKLMAPALATERIFDSQISLLSSIAAQALMAASVQGHGFALEPLAIVLNLPIAELSALVDLELAHDHRLVWPGGSTLINGQDVREYQFSHMLLRDHLYNDRMTDLERAHLHLETAEALLALYGEGANDTTSVVALHLDQSGEVQRAAEAWMLAGSHALDASQYDRAEAAFLRVRELDLRITSPVLAAEALIGLGICSRAMDRHAESRNLLNQALVFARRRRLPQVEAHALSHLGMLAYDEGQVTEGSALLREAIALNEKTGDREEASRSLARLSHNLHGLGLYDEAVIEAQRGIELARQLENPSLICGSSIALGNCWLDIGLLAEATKLYNDVLATAERLVDHHRVNICYLNLALCAIEAGNWDEAASANNEVLIPTRPVVPRFTGVAEFQAGLIAEGRSQFDLARLHFQQSLDIRRRNGQEALQIDSLAGLLRVAVAKRECGIARRLMVDIDERVSRHGLDGIEHVARVCIAMLTGGILTGNRSLAERYGTSGMAHITVRANRLANEDHRRIYLTVTPTPQFLHNLVTQLAEEPDWPARVPLASD